MAGRLLTAEPPGKPHLSLNVKFLGLVSFLASTSASHVGACNKAGGFCPAAPLESGLLPPGTDMVQNALPLPGSPKVMLAKTECGYPGCGRDTSEVALSEFLLGLAFLTLAFPSSSHPCCPASINSSGAAEALTCILHRNACVSCFCFSLSFSLSSLFCPLSGSLSAYPFSLAYLLSISSCLLSPAFFFNK